MIYLQSKSKGCGTKANNCKSFVSDTDTDTAYAYLFHIK